jgi:hypothetical protein
VINSQARTVIIPLATQSAASPTHRSRARRHAGGDWLQSYLGAADGPTRHRAGRAQNRRICLLLPTPDHACADQRSAVSSRSAAFYRAPGGYLREEQLLSVDVYPNDASATGSQDHPSHLAGPGENRLHAGEDVTDKRREGPLG